MHGVTEAPIAEVRSLRYFTSATIPSTITASDTTPEKQPTTARDAIVPGGKGPVAAVTLVIVEVGIGALVSDVPVGEDGCGGAPVPMVTLVVADVYPSPFRVDMVAEDGDVGSPAMMLGMAIMLTMPVATDTTI